MEKPTFKEESLKYHIEGKPGKLEVRATTPLETQADLSMAYSPGVALPVSTSLRTLLTPPR